MLIKVCGMRDARNIKDAEALRPNWMGFICWPKSSRYVDECPSYMPSMVERVGIFVDAELSFIEERVKQLHLDRVQLHGSETPKQCMDVARATGLPVIKAISVRTIEDIMETDSYEGIVSHFLFDKKCKCVGGSGDKFDWDILKHYNGQTPFILAGGIAPDDVARLKKFQHQQFAGIDLNSRFEVSAGMKDIESLRCFIEEVRK